MGFISTDDLKEVYDELDIKVDEDDLEVLMEKMEKSNFLRCY